MNLKNVLENLIYIFAIGIIMALNNYFVMPKMFRDVMQRETTKIENTITQTIENKFKKVGSVTNETFPAAVLEKTDYVPKVAGKDSICIPIKNLTRRQKKRLDLE
ncbi:hypothetical protein LCGC14_1526360 [marine sediment metagenome]|uniref:Uncharacterized protein n=2 Tax=root TaxID=1 RepID=A0A831QKF0_9FLAO|nr:hypothetical protein [Pricia antarctica]